VDELHSLFTFPHEITKSNETDPGLDKWEGKKGGRKSKEI